MRHQLLDDACAAGRPQLNVEHDGVGPQSRNQVDGGFGNSFHSADCDVAVALQQFDEPRALRRDVRYHNGADRSGGCDHAAAPSSRRTALSRPASSKPLLTM